MLLAVDNLDFPKELIQVRFGTLNQVECVASTSGVDPNTWLGLSLVLGFRSHWNEQTGRQIVDLVVNVTCTDLL